MKAMITEIKRFAVHDGDGIRTTVFFKGCNLNCAWCHNPETISKNKQLAFYEHKCSGCGKCRNACRYSSEICDLCGKCTEVCPLSARKIYGTEMTAEEILEIILRDKAFYETSGGGVTFSGGECMLQADFLAGLLKKCKENSIHTAVDTAGNVPRESFIKVLPYTDIFLYDIKTADPALHKKYTGSGNRLILENLKFLSDSGAKITVRVPVIGGVNDSESEIKSIAEILKPLNIFKTELLPYHDMYISKNRAVNRDIPVFSIPSKEKMVIFENIFENIIKNT